MVNYQPERQVIAAYLILSVLGQPPVRRISKGLVDFPFNTALLSKLESHSFPLQIKVLDICRLGDDEYVFRWTEVRQKLRTIPTWPHCLTLSHKPDSKACSFPFTDIWSGAMSEHHSSSQCSHLPSARLRHRSRKQSKALQEEKQKLWRREGQAWGFHITAGY